MTAKMTTTKLRFSQIVFFFFTILGNLYMFHTLYVLEKTDSGMFFCCKTYVNGL